MFLYVNVATKRPSSLGVPFFSNFILSQKKFASTKQAIIFSVKLGCKQVLKFHGNYNVTFTNKQYQLLKKLPNYNNVNTDWDSDNNNEDNDSNNDLNEDAKIVIILR